MQHSLMALSNELGVLECLFGHCVPRAWLRLPHTWVRSLAWGVANPGCTLMTVMKRC